MIIWRRVVIYLAAPTKRVFLIGTVLFVQSIALGDNLPDEQDPVTVSTELTADWMLRVFIQNNSDSSILVFSNRTRPPFFRFVVLDRTGQNILPVSWRGDTNSSDIKIASGKSKHFDIDIDAWFPELKNLTGAQCIDFLWVWNVSIDGFDMPFFFGGAVPLSCQYQNMKVRD